MKPRSARPPWFVPVPVRRSGFVPQFPENAPLNIETDLAGITPFDRQVRGLPDDRILYADLQDGILRGFAPGRLGSGRSGVYLGYYLKGVGRTLAAANWNDPKDARHNSGHLPVRAALNERLISVLAEAKGLRDLIQPCVGILVHQDGTQALSVKRSGFTRYSNLNWFMNHLGYAQPLSFRSFISVLVKTFSASGPSRYPEPRALARSIDERMRAAMARLELALTHGLTLASAGNNHTVDGRILDLESAIWWRAPVLAVWKNSPTGTPIGLEAFEFRVQTYRFIRLLEDKLAQLVELDASLQIVERVYAKELQSELKRVFKPGHPVRDSKRHRQRFESLLARRLDLSPKGRAQLRRWMELVSGRALPSSWQREFKWRRPEEFRRIRVPAFIADAGQAQSLVRLPKFNAPARPAPEVLRDLRAAELALSSAERPG